jgi:outer membrane biosynthesis protein TonB
MALRDAEMQVVSIAGTAVLTIALFAPVLFLTESAAAQKSDFGEMESIEASIAYKKTPQKQPQKKFKAPDPVEKQEAVSHDEKKKPDETKKPEEQKKPPKKDDTDPLAKFKHADDSDDPTGKPTTQPVGDFNGQEYGWASETKGHPFFQAFAADIHKNFQLPTISDANGSPVGCFHMSADGKIVETKLKDSSGSPDLDRAAQDSIVAVQKLRNDDPKPVPTELLGQINRWICFRFNPNSSSPG